MENVTAYPDRLRTGCCAASFNDDKKDAGEIGRGTQ
jgi:hypothetical protein